MRLIRGIVNTFVAPRLLFALAGLVLWFLFSYWFPAGYLIGLGLIFSLTIGLMIDLVLLFNLKDGITASRRVSEKLSNGDPNPVTLGVSSHYRFLVRLELIDELPVQFQVRDFLKTVELPPYAETNITYKLVPSGRGVYEFGKLHVFARSGLGLVKRRYSFGLEAAVKVYPSFIQMKKYDFMAFTRKNMAHGLKKMRRIGHSMEFDQIKDYVVGDDIRTLNWKATAKRAGLMANQFQEERAQPIYLLIDTGRVMKMPFDGLTLLDHAINCSLSFANIALKRKDKVGLISFSDKIHQRMPANNSKTYLMALSEALYPINTQHAETDFSLLYGMVKRKVSHRSLLILFTNFEHVGGLHRQLPYLQGLAKRHLLVVVFFENPALHDLLDGPAESTWEIYRKAMAQKFDYAKRQMVLELEKRGIQTILTPPSELTIHTINKYLEIKTRGIL